MHRFVFASVLLILATLGGTKGQGCDPYRSYASHTMCIYNAKTCSGKRLIRSGELTCQQKNEVVALHNTLRQSVALGRVSGQPSAQNMAEMVWDDELATVAQRWTDQCNFGHDKERRVARFGVGQNAYMSSAWPIQQNTNPDMSAAVNAWFNEVSTPGFQAKNIDPFVWSSGAGHYTQVAWATTYTVGCGYVMYSESNGWSSKYIVCNYGPAGNVIGPGQRMYIRGNPNCAAQGEKPSTNYPGLCAYRRTNPIIPRCVTSFRSAQMDSSNLINGTSGDQSNVKMDVPKFFREAVV